MRRKEREVTDKKEILEILAACDTIHLALQGEEYPYVVPLSFGLLTTGEKTVVYFHCAREGKKLDLIRRQPQVSFAADLFLKYEKTEHGITTRYRSVIGFGKCTVVESEQEIMAGLEAILAHCGQTGYPVGRCRGLQNLYVCRIEVAELTGKQNLPAVPDNIMPEK